MPAAGRTLKMRALVGMVLTAVVGAVALASPTSPAGSSGGARTDNCVKPHLYVVSGWFVGTVCVTQKYGCTDVPQESPAPWWRHCPRSLPNWHRGVDLSLNCGTQLHTPVTINDVSIGEDPKHNNKDSGFGPYYPRLQLPDGASVILGHAERTLVGPHPASPLPPGTLIALSGGARGSGSTTGCHLHFEVDKAGERHRGSNDINPMPYLSSVRISGAVGTWNDRRLGVIGTSVLLNILGKNSISQESVNGYVINGPQDWNSGSSASFGRHHPPDAAPGRTLYWSFVTPLSGVYTLSGNHDTARGTASDNSSSRLGAPRIAKAAIVSLAGRQSITFKWHNPSGAKSYLLRINRSPWPGSSEGERVVTAPPTSTSGEAVIGNLSLRIGSYYQIVVWAFSDDIKTPGPVAGPFNIASDSWRFRYSGPGPINQLPPISHPQAPAQGAPVGDLPSP